LPKFNLQPVHLFFYNIFLLLYKTIIRIAALWNPKARLWLNGRRDMWHSLESGVGSREPKASQESEASGPGLPTIDYQLKTKDARLVWMHCSSLGEYEQGKPVLEKIRAAYPGVKIVLTFFSPSGYEVKKNSTEADYITYLPMDAKHAAKRFLDIVKPDMAIWVKYEYWYYFLLELKKRNIPVLLVSGIFRREQPFFKWYGRLHQYMLESFMHMFVQTEESKKLLGTIGFTGNVTVSGDTRFDRVTTIAQQFEPLPDIEAFCGDSPVIVAGSTWDDDEEELDHYANTHPEIKFIVAPHEIHEEHLKDIERLFKNTIRYSKYKTIDPNKPRPIPRSQSATNQQPATTPAEPRQQPALPNVLIIDNFGMLSRLYNYATITYVGGGFGDDGVHNVLEAAVYGKPVVFGPVYDKYVEAVELVEAGGGHPIETALELEKLFDTLLADATAYTHAANAAHNYVHNKTGATGKVLQFIQEKRLLIN
jgi:3-deoxy-D-manno-octulosonic-acid transferase